MYDELEWSSDNDSILSTLAVNFPTDYSPSPSWRLDIIDDSAISFKMV